MSTTFAMASPLNFRTKALASATKTWSLESEVLLRLASFRPRLSAGLVFQGVDMVMRPLGKSLKEAKVGILEIGPLHNLLEKGCD
jgi:hypothetical protein